MTENAITNDCSPLHSGHAESLDCPRAVRLARSARAERQAHRHTGHGDGAHIHLRAYCRRQPRPGVRAALHRPRYQLATQRLRQVYDRAHV